MESKNKGLVLTGIGEILYLFQAILLIGFTFPSSIFPFSLLYAGLFSVIGTIVGRNEIKLGGAIVLLSIPTSIAFTLIFNAAFESIPYSIAYNIVIFVLYPIPYPHSVFVIIGGLLCLTSSDE